MTSAGSLRWLRAVYNITILTTDKVQTMGPCLSCLRAPEEDNDANERTSLLGNGNHFSAENYHEELLKQQQRQNELNGIVNDLSDNLIDVSTFITGKQLVAQESTSTGRGEPATTTLANFMNSPSIKPAGLDSGKSYPRLLDNDEKQRILASSKDEDVVPIANPQGPLYVTF